MKNTNFFYCIIYIVFIFLLTFLISAQKVVERMSIHANQKVRVDFGEKKLLSFTYQGNKNSGDSFLRIDDQKWQGKVFLRGNEEMYEYSGESIVNVPIKSGDDFTIVP